MLINEERYKDIDLDKVNMTVRLYNVSKRHGIDNLYALLESYYSGEFATFRNAGIKCLEEIEALSIGDIVADTEEFASDSENRVLGKNDGNAEENRIDFERKPTKEIDYNVVERLINEYGFKISRLCNWYGITRQGVDIRYKHAKRKQEKLKYTWEGFELTSEEESIFKEIINDELTEMISEDVIYEYYSNLKGDICFIVVSENAIKCFFLQDMSDDIKQLVEDKKIAFFSFEELDIVKSSKYVMRLREKYLIPVNKAKLTHFARKRDISPEEYCQLIAGCKLGSEKGITDDDIIAFFEENINEEGKVHIKADPKNQWIKSYASRNGFGINDFISFYGYESALANSALTSEGARQRHLQTIQEYIVHDDVVYIPCTSDFYRVLNSYSSKRKMTISEYVEELGFTRISSLHESSDDEYFDEGFVEADEYDMQVYEGGEDFIDKIYAQNPLLGNYIFSEKNLAILNNSAKKTIDKIIIGKNSMVTEREKRILALSVINYAKKWDTDKGPFTNYIIKQYGYRSEDRVYYPIIGEVFSAISEAQRWCFTSHGKNQYKSTIMIHAMGSVRSWLTLCDFLSDFYQNNLGCNFDEEDPYILKMVIFLRGLFYRMETEEDDNYVEFTVGAKPYSFQEGIRKLVVYKPNYAAEVFSRMIRRIDESMSSLPIKARNYEDDLVDLWFKNKKDYYSRFRRETASVKTTKRKVAYTFSSLRPEYIIIDSRIYIDLPDIRIDDEDAENCTIELSTSNGEIILKNRVELYGNELGRTIKGFTYDLTDYLSFESSSYIEPRIKIFNDNKVIYDSENKLRRKTICFSDNKECAWSAVKTGKYVIVAHKAAEIAGEKTYILSEKTVGKFRITDVELDDEYLLTVDDVLVSYDQKKSQKIRLSIREYSFPAKYVENGQEYSICKNKEHTQIIVDANDTEQKYLLYLNDNRILLSDLICEEIDSSKVYSIPSEMIQIKNRLQIIDISSGHLLYDKWYIYIPNLICDFDKTFYFTRRELRESTVVYRLDGIEKEIANFSGDESIDIPYLHGNIAVELPMIRIESLDGKKWKPNNYHVGDIEAQCCVKITAPIEMSYKLVFGDKDILPDENDIIHVGEVITHTTDKKEERLFLVITCDDGASQSYEIGKIKFDESFISIPKLEYANGSIMWDCGYGFIGERTTATYIDICDIEGKKLWSSEIDIQSTTIIDNIELEDGEYGYEIYRIDTKSLHNQVLAEGKFVSGDIDVIRFKKYRIEIDQIVFDNAVESGVKNIMKAYIDNIVYDAELSKIEGSEGICPRYTGTMYFINPDGKRHDYAFEEEVRSETDIRLKTNPVNLTYINDGIMLITDYEDDALMYRYFKDRISHRTIYHITDHAINEWEKNRYDTVDLVRYQRVRDE